MRADTRNNRQRHEWLERLCARLWDMSLSDADVVTEEASAVVVLPMWVYLTPKVNVGSKSRSGLIPSRIVWDGENDRHLTQLVAGQSVDIAWEAPGLGYDPAPSGSVHVEVGEIPSIEYDTWGVPSRIRAVVSSPSELRMWEDEVHAQAKESEWAVYAMLEHPARLAAEHACYAISYEIAGYQYGDETSSAVPLERTVRPVLDPISLEGVSTELLVGTESRNPMSSPVMRIVERCMRPTSFVHVEPLRFIQTALQRDAAAIIRRRIEDPHIGPKVRRVMREHQPATVEELVEIYSGIYPSDRLSNGRAEKAITVGHDVMTFHLVADNTGNTLISRLGSE